MPAFHYFLIFLVITSWGVHFPIIKLGLEEISPWMMLTLRFLGCILIFVPFLKFNWQRFKKVAPIGFWFNAVHLTGAVLTIKFTDAATASFLFKLYVPLTVIIVWLTMGEKPRLLTWLGMAVSLGGLLVITGAPAFTLLGVLALIPAALGAAMREIKMKQAGKITPSELVVYGSVIGLPVALGFTLLLDRSGFNALSSVDWFVVAPVIFYQVVVMSFSMVVWQYVLRENPVNKVVPYNLANPIPAFIASYFMVGQMINLPLVIGGSLILVGIGLHTFSKR